VTQSINKHIVIFTILNFPVTQDAKLWSQWLQYFLKLKYETMYFWRNPFFILSHRQFTLVFEYILSFEFLGFWISEFLNYFWNKQRFLHCIKFVKRWRISTTRWYNLKNPWNTFGFRYLLFNDRTFTMIVHFLIDKSFSINQWQYAVTYSTYLLFFLDQYRIGHLAAPLSFLFH